MSRTVCVPPNYSKTVRADAETCACPRVGRFVQGDATVTNNMIVIAALVIAGCISGPVPKSPEPRDPDSTSAAAATTKLVEEHRLTRVEPSQVCMVNNRFMGKPQIPVDVAGKTYFGCCEMCKSRLADDPSARTAVDPLTGTTVDKADAVVGRDNSGVVLYFENEANLNRYQATGS